MVRILLILALTVIMAGLGVSYASAQDDGDLRLSRVMHMQIKPGQLAAFAAARARIIEHQQEHGFRWRQRVSINENNVVRISTRLNEGWADMQAMSEWRQNTPRANSGMREAVEFLGTRIVQFIPELAYAPENPRVPYGEFNFSRELRLYPSPGRGQAFREFMGTVQDAFQEADSGQPRFVRRSVVGSGGFSLTVSYPAKDVIDSYASRDEIQAIFQALDFTPGNIRRVRTVNWTFRRDLGFVPSN